jgi:predicted RNase H-like HicB family nuclease
MAVVVKERRSIMSTVVQEHPASAPPYVYGPPVVVEVMVKVQALAFREADGRYSVVVPELPGCVTHTMGDDVDEVPAMVREAAEGWLAAGHDENRQQAIRNVTEPFPGEVSG